MLVEKIIQWVEEEFINTTCFLVDVKVAGHNNAKIQVLVDCELGISIETCAKLSRHLEHKLEINKLVPDQYYLEVSSPGVGIPFKVKRQYLKSINRSLELELQNGTLVEGKLISVSESEISIEKSNSINYKGKAKKKDPSEDVIIVNIPFEEIKTASEKIVF